MIDFTQIKSLVFDFGGTLDSNGVHSRTLFFRAFKQFNLLSQEDNKVFQDAYSYSDHLVISQGLIKKSNLLEMNQIMCHHIFKNLQMSENENVAKEITNTQMQYLKENHRALTVMSEHFEMGIISNFSGNLSVVLDEFDLLDLFDFVLDSYYVGFSKPDPRIFQKALELSEFNPNQIFYLGDNHVRDVLAAKSLGFKTGLIYDCQEQTLQAVQAYSQADLIVTSIFELLDFI